MAKFTVPKAGYDFTIPQRLPAQLDVRTSMFRQMGELTTGDDEFALIDGGLALHCFGGRFKKKELRGQRVNPAGHLGLVILSGDGKKICGKLLSILSGEVEGTADKPARAVQPIQAEWRDEIIPRTGYPLVTFWGERLPDALQNVTLNDLRSYFREVLACIKAGYEHSSLVDVRDELRKLGEGITPLALVLLVSDPDFRDNFMSYDGLFRWGNGQPRPLWNEFVKKAIELVPPELRKNSDADTWTPTLPPEFKGIRVGSSPTLDGVVQAISCLESGASLGERCRLLPLFKDPVFALYVVHYICNQPDSFRPYRHLILPRWDAWVKTARRALLDR